MAQQTKETARVAKEMVYRTTHKPVYKVGQPKSKANSPRAKDTPQGKLHHPLSLGACGRCRKRNYTSKDCPHINDVCHNCQKRDICICLLVQMKAGHGGQVPVTAGYSKDSEDDQY